MVVTGSWKLNLSDNSQSYLPCQTIITLRLCQRVGWMQVDRNNLCHRLFSSPWREHLITYHSILAVRNRRCGLLFSNSNLFLAPNSRQFCGKIRQQKKQKNELTTMSKNKTKGQLYQILFWVVLTERFNSTSTENSPPRRWPGDGGSIWRTGALSARCEGPRAVLHEVLSATQADPWESTRDTCTECLPAGRRTADTSHL